MQTIADKVTINKEDLEICYETDKHMLVLYFAEKERIKKNLWSFTKKWNGCVYYYSLKDKKLSIPLELEEISDCLNTAFPEYRISDARDFFEVAEKLKKIPVDAIKDIILEKEFKEFLIQERGWDFC